MLPGVAAAPHVGGVDFLDQLFAPLLAHEFQQGADLGLEPLAVFLG